ncbi:hypothetical protein [Paenibacillus sp. NPDC058174]|uniref:hypothetical protein n=1 Tax=Paenibacillus sp. NPDC058174 TaxID=3346366 RepID=UPI0036DF7C44
MRKSSLVLLTSAIIGLLLVSGFNRPATAANSVTPQYITGTDFKMLDTTKLPSPVITDEKETKIYLDKLVTEAYEVWLKEKDVAAVNDFYRENNCIVLTPEKAEVYGEVSSNNTDVTMGTPTVVYEMYSGNYIISATMQWNKSGSTPKWMNDFTGGAGDAEVVGLSLGNGASSSFTNKGYLMFTEDKNDVNTGTITNAQDWDNSGVIFRPQDVFLSDINGQNKNYNIDGYYISLYVKYNGPAVGVPIFSQYGHSWTKTAIGSWGFSTGGVSISYVDSNYAWKASSGPKYFN